MIKDKVMRRKAYNITEDAPVGVKERTGLWGPNRVFNGTQDEFMEHIRNIEAGEFMTIEEADKKFEEWRKEYHANRIR
jgi:hypothetical protein